MKTLGIIIKRNTKLFFKDKGMFFTSLITPLILLVLYATFLGNVYKDSFMSFFPDAFVPEQKLIDACVAGQLVSSILAVSCVTVAFCSNMLMVQDRANGSIKDFTISPVRPHILSLGYYISTMISTLIICIIALIVCLIYTATIGFYMSIFDICLLLLDVFLLSMFGTALSSVINFFLSTQGQISAVGSIVSSCYGFICGAYMPTSQFSEGLRNVISFLPGTYGTSLLRNNALRGVFEEMESSNIPKEAINAIRVSVDCNVEFFGNVVPQYAMYIVLISSILLLLGAYVAMNIIRHKPKEAK